MLVWFFFRRKNHSEKLKRICRWRSVWKCGKIDPEFISAVCEGRYCLLCKVRSNWSGSALQCSRKWVGVETSTPEDYESVISLPNQKKRRRNGINNLGKKNKYTNNYHYRHRSVKNRSKRRKGKQSSKLNVSTVTNGSVVTLKDSQYQLAWNFRYRAVSVLGAKRWSRGKRPDNSVAVCVGGTASLKLVCFD